MQGVKYEYTVGMSIRMSRSMSRSMSIPMICMGRCWSGDGTCLVGEGGERRGLPVGIDVRDGLRWGDGAMGLEEGGCDQALTDQARVSPCS